ncbi:MAG: esterase/lipase family protein [Myxococcaceae bacterium]
MTRDFPASERPTRVLVAREVAALAAFSLLHPFGWRAERKRTARRRDQRTVVLVHGYGANRSSFLPLSLYLRAHGVRQILAFDYRASAGIEQAARALKHYLRDCVRGGRIDLLCHSLGGLVARVYLEQLGGARRVDRCITLGTPHRGTYNAYWVATRVGRELRPDSPVLERLASTEGRAQNVRYTCIVAGSDNIIIPRVFAAGDDMVHVPDVGHLGMLFSPAVARAVLDRLMPPGVDASHVSSVDGVTKPR